MKEKNILCNERDTLLFGSVIYSDALKYFDEFIDSIRRQTTNNFNILLLIDGISAGEVEKGIRPIQNRCKIVSYKEKYTPSQLRVKLIQEARKYKAEILVIGDADDLFSDNRIESIIKTFKKNSDADFVYNELFFFDGSRVMPEIPEKLSDIECIAEKNFLGMSNTAIKVSALDDSFINSLLECSSFVFDWYFYSRMLLAGYKGTKVKEAYTLYRIHDGNYAELPITTEAAIKREIEIKKQHYKLLTKNDKLFDILYSSYSDGRIRRTDSEYQVKTSHYWWNLTKALK